MGFNSAFKGLIPQPRTNYDDRFLAHPLQLIISNSSVRSLNYRLCLRISKRLFLNCVVYFIDLFVTRLSCSRLTHLSWTCWVVRATEDKNKKRLFGYLVPNRKEKSANFVSESEVCEWNFWFGRRAVLIALTSALKQGTTPHLKAIQHY
jgi:hypothetical protein